MVDAKPDNLYRMWSLFRLIDGEAEEAVGAIVEGRLPTVIDNPPPEPFVAMISFARLGEPKPRIGEDGRRFSVRPVLEGHPRSPFGWRCEDIDTAMRWLEERKSEFLAEPSGAHVGSTSCSIRAAGFSFG